ncbi:MAG: hypothetical protein GX600_08440 [Dehalococcoidia bacterium]|jgi:hypothetical protein|nr:hypothetical protein [Dehalococcoidia bacterium]
MAYAAGAAAAAVAQAIKASGAIVNMEPDDFMSIVNRCEKPLVVMASGGLLDRGFRYLVGYKGLIFHTKSKTELMLSGRTEVVHAKSIWIPG